MFLGKQSPVGSLGRSTHGEGFRLLPLVLLHLPTPAFALSVLWGAGPCCTWIQSILYPGPVGPSPPQGPELLFPFSWLSGPAPAAVLVWLGWHWLSWEWAGSWMPGSLVKSIDPVVTLDSLLVLSKLQFRHHYKERIGHCVCAC